MSCRRAAKRADAATYAKHASLNVYHLEFGFTGSQEVDSQAPFRQSSPGPILLELFGLEETQDEPLELPVQARMTVQSTAVPGSAQAHSTLSQTGQPHSDEKCHTSAWGATEPPCVNKKASVYSKAAACDAPF